MVMKWIYYVKNSQGLTIYPPQIPQGPGGLRIRLSVTTTMQSIINNRLKEQDRDLIKKIKEEIVVIEITAPMGGKVLEVKVKPGDSVNEDDEVIILEAMKMELPVVATGSGTVKEVKCNSGDTVEADAVLVVLE